MNDLNGYAESMLLDVRIASNLRRMAGVADLSIQVLEVAGKTCEACGVNPRTHDIPLCPSCLRRAADRVAPKRGET